MSLIYSMKLGLFSHYFFLFLLKLLIFEAFVYPFQLVNLLVCGLLIWLCFCWFGWICWSFLSSSEDLVFLFLWNKGTFLLTVFVKFLDQVKHWRCNDNGSENSCLNLGKLIQIIQCLNLGKVIQIIQFYRSFWIHLVAIMNLVLNEWLRHHQALFFWWWASARGTTVLLISHRNCQKIWQGSLPNLSQTLSENGIIHWFSCHDMSHTLS